MRKVFVSVTAEHETDGRIMGKETYLFDDEGRWFVEAK